MDLLMAWMVDNKTSPTISFIVNQRNQEAGPAKGLAIRNQPKLHVCRRRHHYVVGACFEAFPTEGGDTDVWHEAAAAQFHVVYLHCIVY